MEVFTRRIPSPLRQWWKGFAWSLAIGLPLIAATGVAFVLLRPGHPSDSPLTLLGIPGLLAMCVLEFFLAVLLSAVARTRACVHHKQITVAGYIGFCFPPLLPPVILWALLDKKRPPGSRLPL